LRIPRTPLLTKLSPNGRYILAAFPGYNFGAGKSTKGFSVALWDAITGNPLLTSNPAATIWAASTGSSMRHMSEDYDELLSISFSADSTHILAIYRTAGSTDVPIKVVSWNTETGEPEFTSLTELQGLVSSAVFSADATLVAVVSKCSLRSVFNDRDSLQDRRSISSRCEQAATTSTPILSIWNVITGKLENLTMDRASSHAFDDAKPGKLIFSPTGHHVALYSQDGYIRIWNTVSQNLEVMYRLQNRVIWTMQFSPDCSCIAHLTAGDRKHGKLVVWKVMSKNKSDD